MKKLQSLNESDFTAKLKIMTDASRRLKKEGKDVKKILNSEGVEALMKVAKKVPGSANKFSAEVEKAILDYTLEYPLYGQRRVAKELNKAKGWKISEGGVRRVWLRNKLQLTELRIKRLKAHAATGAKLSEAQKDALNPQKNVKPIIEDFKADYPGQLLAQEVFYMGEVKGIGKIYQQLAIDVFSGVVIAKAYTSKTAILASEFLNSKVLPFYEQHNAVLKTIVTNQGLSYCGNISHPFQLFLAINKISHKVERDVAPQLLRARDIFLQDYYGRINETKPTDIETLNHFLQDFVEYYNKTRKSKDRWKGQFPMTIFRDGVRRFSKKTSAKAILEGSKRWQPRSIPQLTVQ